MQLLAFFRKSRQKLYQLYRWIEAMSGKPFSGKHLTEPLTIENTLVCYHLIVSKSGDGNTEREKMHTLLPLNIFPYLQIMIEPVKSIVGWLLATSSKSSFRQ